MIMQEFDTKKFSYIMYLHNYRLACEISTVRTLALRHNKLKRAFKPLWKFPLFQTFLNLIH